MACLLLEMALIRTQYSSFKHASQKFCYFNLKSLLFKHLLPKSSKINELFSQGKRLG